MELLLFTSVNAGILYLWIWLAFNEKKLVWFPRFMKGAAFMVLFMLIYEYLSLAI